MVKYPANSIENTYNRVKTSNKTLLSFAYEKDLIQMYDFYCARYENISWEDFMELGINEFTKKIMSIPENEPLHTIIKSRSINIAKIKDKNEKKYWQELKRLNEIPDIYIPNEELDIDVSKKLGGLINGNKFNQFYGKN